MKYLKDSVKTYFLVEISDLFEIWRHHQKMIYVKCAWGADCPKKEPCRLHEKLYKLINYFNWVRGGNLYSKNEVISKIALFFEERSCEYELFWWYNLCECEHKNVPKGADIRWRTHYM